MYEIFTRTHFSAAHYLRGYRGKCENLHGHNWTVEAVVQTEKLDAIDLGIDFKDLKAAVGRILSELDHTNVNDHPAFAETNPSSESIASYIYRRLGEELAPFPGVRPKRVTVCETPNNGVTYSQD